MVSRAAAMSRCARSPPKSAPVWFEQTAFSRLFKVRQASPSACRNRERAPREQAHSRIGGSPHSGNTSTTARMCLPDGLREADRNDPPGTIWRERCSTGESDASSSFESGRDFFQHAKCEHNLTLNRSGFFDVFRSSRRLDVLEDTAAGLYRNASRFWREKSKGRSRLAGSGR